jgi:hypothetical protein
MAIFSVGELDFIEGQPFWYSDISDEFDPKKRYSKDVGKLRYEAEVPGTWITSAKKERWVLKRENGKDYDLNDVNLLNTNKFNKSKKNLYFYNGHETPRTKKLKEDKEHQQAEEKASIDAENERIAAENKRIAEENKRIAEEKRQEESRKWHADWLAKAPERQRIAAEEKRVREEKEELLRQKIMEGTPATRGNIFIDDRVKHKNREASVIDERYEIKYGDGTTDVVKLSDLINITAVERTLKQEAKNKEMWRSGGTRRKRKRKNRKTRYGMETRS